MTLMLMIGGPMNGEFFETYKGMQCVTAYEPLEVDFQQADYTEPFMERPNLVTYVIQKIGCPDRWIEYVLVDETLELDEFDESDWVGFVMAGWRKRKGQKQ